MKTLFASILPCSLFSSHTWILLLTAVLLSSSRAYGVQDIEKDSLSSATPMNEKRNQEKKHSKLLKLSGDFRYRAAYLKNEDFGESQEQSESFSLYRALIGAKITPSKNLSFFTQVQSSLISSKTYGVSSVDKNELDLHQAFAEYIRGSLKLKVGRQELSYGSQRLISVREIPNNRQAFDGAKLSFEEKSFSFDLMYMNYVISKEGAFNDNFSRDLRLWGAYLTCKSISKKWETEVYYLGIQKQRAVFANGRGLEQRHSVGSRIFGKAPCLNYDLEGVYQFGKLGNSQISAWTFSSNVNGKIASLPMDPIIGLKTDIISGDNNNGEGMGTFNPLFPKGAYFGLAALIGPANLMDLHPSLEFELKEDKLNLGIESLFMWRYSTDDGIYAPNVALAFDAPRSRDRYIGSQFASTLNYTPVKNLLLRAEFTFFNTGAFLKAASPGKDIVFAAFTTQLKL